MIDFLQTIPLFATLDGGELKELLRTMGPFHVGAGDPLFAQGSDALGMYIIERGEVEVRVRSAAGDEVVLAHLGNGAVIGEMALLAGGVRSATVGAVSQTQGFRLSRQDFETMQGRGRPVAFKIILQMARTIDDRLRQLETRFHQLKADPEVAKHLERDADKELIARARLT